MMLHHMAGFYLVFQAMRYQVRKELKRQIKTGLPEKQLITIWLPKAVAQTDLHWIEAHEFRYKGMLYDVVKQTDTADSVMYYCINDVQEQILFAGLQQQVNARLATQAHIPNKGLFENLLISHFQPYLLPSAEFPAFIRTSLRHLFPSYSTFYLSCTLFQAGPPPEFA